MSDELQFVANRSLGFWDDEYCDMINGTGAAHAEMCFVK